MTEVKSAPIGVFDSGIGGLTVLTDLRARFPHEDFVFIADSAHVPYGTKSREEIARLACGCGEALVAQGAKAIVIACNTATANADLLRARVTVPVIGAIAPTARLAARVTKTGRIAILATRMTIGLKAYEKELEALKGTRDFTYFPLATQDFVTRVEEGRIGTEEARDAVAKELAPLSLVHADTVILGCTHFPRLAPEIAQALPEARLVTSGEAIAEELARVLSSRDLLRDDSSEGTIKLFTTGSLASFQRQITWFAGPASVGTITTI